MRRTWVWLNGCCVEDRLTALGRLHSVTKGYYREAKLQRQLYGDEPEEM